MPIPLCNFTGAISDPFLQCGWEGGVRNRDAQERADGTISTGQGQGQSDRRVGQCDPCTSSFAHASETLFNFCKDSRQHPRMVPRRTQSALIRRSWLGPRCRGRDNLRQDVAAGCASSALLSSGGCPQGFWLGRELAGTSMVELSAETCIEELDVYRGYNFVLGSRNRSCRSERACFCATDLRPWPGSRGPAERYLGVLGLRTRASWLLLMCTLTGAEQMEVEGKL